MGYSKGITWIDDTRIPFVNEGDKNSAKPMGKTLKHKGWDTDKWLEETKEPHNKGRFTPNLLVSDDMLNDGSISKSDGRKIYPNEDTNIKNNVLNKGWIRTGSDIKDKGSNSRYYDIDIWFKELISNLVDFNKKL